MIDKLHHIVTEVFRDVPDSLFVVLLALLCVGTVVFLTLIGRKRGARWAVGLLLFEYMALLVVSTVLVRKANVTRLFDFSPFWSYRAIMKGDPYLLIQNIANVGAFIPIGFLLGCTFGRMKWWIVMAIGGGFSLLIEVLQFAFMRGFAEFDDVFHNVLGCVIGFGVYVLAIWLIRHPSSIAAARSK